MNSGTFKLIILGGLVVALILALAPRPSGDELNLYSSRNEGLIKPLLDEFTEATGVQVNLLTGSGSGLLSRLESEGANTPADLFITVDAGNLHRAKAADLFAPVSSDVLMERVPDYLRDEDNKWFGLSLRSRPLFYAPDRVNPEHLSTYEDLADSRWEGRICTRSSDNVYNQSLVAAMIAHHGEEATEEWVRGLVNNFARNPVGGDRDQIHAVASGQCDIAIANTYYYGGMSISDSQANRETVARTEIFWPNQDSTGVHINVSGIGVVRHSDNQELARELMEFLTSDLAQQWYAEANQEYPVNPDSEWSETLQEWGEYRMDELPMNALGEYNSAAVRLMNRAGWR